MGEFLYCPCGSQVPELLTTKQLGLLALGGGGGQDDISTASSRPGTPRREKSQSDVLPSGHSVEGGRMSPGHQLRALAAGQKPVAVSSGVPKLLKLYQASVRVFSSHGLTTMFHTPSLPFTPLHTPSHPVTLRHTPSHPFTPLAVSPPGLSGPCLTLLASSSFPGAVALPCGPGQDLWAQAGAQGRVGARGQHLL